MRRGKLKTGAVLSLLIGVAGSSASARAEGISPDEPANKGHGRKPELAAQDEIKTKPKKDGENDARLDMVLRDWERASNAVRQMRYTVQRTEADFVHGTKTVSLGEVFIKKPSLLRVDQKDEKGEVTEVILCKGKELHIYDFTRKFEHVFEIPPKPGVSEKGGDFLGIGAWIHEWVWWIHVGLPLRDLKSRFSMRVDREDDSWSCLEIRPRSRADQGNFLLMQVLLDKKTRWVRRIWIESLNRNTTTWDFQMPTLDPNPPITAESISKDLPRNWRRP
jgi:TIGR03009 family protein